MALTSKNNLKQWFKTALKPTQNQFWNWLDSYWHKSENIPAENIAGLQDLLDEKQDVEGVDKLENLHYFKSRALAKLSLGQGKFFRYEIANYENQIEGAIGLT